MPIWSGVLVGVLALIIGLVAGFFIAKAIFKKYLKKNPPITEGMIRAMMTQMGRSPSEKQVRAVMRSIEEEKGK